MLEKLKNPEDNEIEKLMKQNSAAVKGTPEYMKPFLLKALAYGEQEKPD